MHTRDSAQGCQEEGHKLLRVTGWERSFCMGVPRTEQKPPRAEWGRNANACVHTAFPGCVLSGAGHRWPCPTQRAQLSSWKQTDGFPKYSKDT